MGQKEGSMPDFGEGDDEDEEAAEPVSHPPSFLLQKYTRAETLACWHSRRRASNHLEPEERYMTIATESMYIDST
jgi:hypothetical protein